MKKFQGFLKALSSPPKDKPHSIYALMPNGSMKKGSIGLMIYEALLEAYNDDYEDLDDKDAILSAITANYKLECNTAWQAFLAEIGYDE